MCHISDDMIDFDSAESGAEITQLSSGSSSPTMTLQMAVITED